MRLGLGPALVPSQLGARSDPQTLVCASRTISCTLERVSTPAAVGRRPGPEDHDMDPSGR